MVNVYAKFVKRIRLAVQNIFGAPCHVAVRRTYAMDDNKILPERHNLKTGIYKTLRIREYIHRSMSESNKKARVHGFQGRICRTNW